MAGFRPAHLPKSIEEPKVCRHELQGSATLMCAECTLEGSGCIVRLTLLTYSDHPSEEVKIMEIEKSFRVAAPQADVWEFITSAEKVAACLPGCDEVQVQGPGQYKGVMTIKVGPIKTSVKADVTETEQRAPSFAAYAIKGEEGGRASRLTADASLALAAVSENETDVGFNASVVLVGRLGKFAGGVMDKLVDSMSEQFITAFRYQLEPQPEIPVEVVQPGLWARFMAFIRRLFGRS
jgi:carbon monoxide dehydrogenase subunit G